MLLQRRVGAAVVCAVTLFPVQRYCGEVDWSALFVSFALVALLEAVVAGDEVADGLGEAVADEVFGE